MSALTNNCIIKHKIIAIIRGVERSRIVPLTQALYDGGIRLVEVTFNQASPTGNEDTVFAIREIQQALGDRLCIGAGTVMTTEQVQLASEAGAQYLISPNTNLQVIQKTKELGLISIPGAITPTEAALAYEHGADFVKLFPAGELGLSYVKAVMAPLNHIPFLVVGGIDESNMDSFLKIGVKGFGIGSNIVKKSLVQEEKYAEIALLAERYTEKLRVNGEEEK